MKTNIEESIEAVGLAREEGEALPLSNQEAEDITTRLEKIKELANHNKLNSLQEAFSRKNQYNLPQPWAVGFEVGAEWFQLKLKELL